jgi:uncharacterized membrane protein
MKKRIIFLDLWRGVAVFAMIVFHFFYILDFYDFLSLNLSDGMVDFLANLVRCSFLILVGISLTFSSKNQVVRGLKLLLIAMGVSLATYLVVGELYVRFGILHLIAFGIILAGNLRKRPSLCLLLAGLVFIGSFWIGDLGLRSWWAYPLGTGGFDTLDYFPIFPWLGFMFLGVWMAKLPWPKVRSVAWLEYLGRHSLKIYLLHIPLIWGLLKVVTLID